MSCASTATLVLPEPALAEGRFASLDAQSHIKVLTDEPLFSLTGVRIAFTSREGGVSAGPYDSLNLGSHVEDNLDCVLENRRILTESLAGKVPLVVPNQVHGNEVLEIGALEDVPAVEKAAAQGADAVISHVPGVAALLCFADCVPVIVVSPTGRFAVVHAGWRGVENCISAKAVSLLANADARQSGCAPEHHAAGMNVYIGPHIRSECFETGAEVHARFVEKFGKSCIHDESHISLVEALRTQLVNAGVCPERICDAGICTVCENESYFSYRAQDGTAGRHGAFAFRFPEDDAAKEQKKGRV